MKPIFRILAFLSVFVVTNSCHETFNDLDIYEEPVALTDSITAESTTLPQKPDSTILNDRKFIYLTIDDAPLNGSAYIDSIISRTQIKANIFMVGNPIDGSGKFKAYYDILKNNSHIEIYNHSYSHANNRYANFYKDPDMVLKDFEKNQTAFGIQYKIARLPGRNLWQIGEKKKNYKQTGSTSAQLLVENGYKVFGWDIEWKYNAKDYSPEQNIDKLMEEIENMYEKSLTFSKNHIVLLMHDQMFSKRNEKNDLEELINKLKEKNYTFEYLSSYPE